MWAAARYNYEEMDYSLSLMDYKRAWTYLQTYSGIGEKVADCICLFGLGRKEAFPVDTWIKRVVTDHYNGHFPIERYKPFAGVLQQFMFYYERNGG